MRYIEMLEELHEDPSQIAARREWCGENENPSTIVWLKPPVDIQESWCHDPILKRICEINEGVVHATGCMCLYTGTKIITGWHPTYEEFDADDWFILDVSSFKQTSTTLKDLIE